MSSDTVSPGICWVVLTRVETNWEVKFFLDYDESTEEFRDFIDAVFEFAVPPFWESRLIRLVFPTYGLQWTIDALQKRYDIDELLTLPFHIRVTGQCDPKQAPFISNIGKEKQHDHSKD